MTTFNFRAFSYSVQIPVSPLNDVLDYHDLTLCLNGKLSYIVNGKTYNLTGGDFIYIPPNAHRVRLESETPAAYFSVNLFGPNEPILSETISPNALDENLMRIIEWAKTAYNSRNYEKIVLLSQYILCDLREKHERQRTNPVVWKIKNYVLQNIHKKLTVDEIAAQVFLSKEYCETLFKRETNTTIVKFINSEKITTAKNLLLLEEYSLIEIAERLGFEDYNYFSRLFKQYTGISPFGYRKLRPKNLFLYK